MMDTDAARRERFEQFFDEHYATVLAYAVRRAQECLPRARPATRPDCMAAAGRDVTPLPWLLGVKR